MSTEGKKVEIRKEDIQSRFAAGLLEDVEGDKSEDLIKFVDHLSGLLADAVVDQLKPYVK
jgi:hypothetical protein